MWSFKNRSTGSCSRTCGKRLAHQKIMASSALNFIGRQGWNKKPLKFGIIVWCFYFPDKPQAIMFGSNVLSKFKSRVFWMFRRSVNQVHNHPKLASLGLPSNFGVPNFRMTRLRTVSQHNIFICKVFCLNSWFLLFPTAQFSALHGSGWCRLRFLKGNLGPSAGCGRSAVQLLARCSQ